MRTILANRPRRTNAGAVGFFSALAPCLSAGRSTDRSKAAHTRPPHRLLLGLALIASLSLDLVPLGSAHAAEPGSTPAAIAPATTAASRAEAAPPAFPASGTNGTTTATGADATAAAAATAARERLADDTLRSYLRLQEQLHTALLAIQQSRAEASAEAQTNVSAMMQRMQALEQELAEQRAQQANAAQGSNRLMIAAAAGVFLVGMGAMVLMTWFQARGMNRLAEIASGMAPLRGLPAGLTGGMEPLALDGGPSRLLLGADGAAAVADGGPGSDGGRLQSTIRRLEGRIREIETTAQGMLEPGADLSSGGAARPLASAAGGTTTGPATDAGPRAIALAKAQALMNLGKADAALKVLEEALATAPRDAELRLRQGLALERLQRFDQAIEAFDEAISLDATSTQAYLAKGGVLNRQQRYQEALACYEQALERRPQA